MNPFAALKARTLLGGGLLITLAAALPLMGWPNSAGLLSFLAYPLLFLWALFLARRYGVKLRRLTGGPVAPDQAVAILALVPALVALDVGLIWLVYTPLSWVSPDSVRDWLDRMERLIPSNLSGIQELVFVTGAVVLAPIVEELVFRGLLLHRWSYKWGRPRGLVLTSIAFAFLHASPVNAFVLGLAFGLIYLSTGSLPLTIAAHALNNLVALEVLPLVGPGGPGGGDTLTEFRAGTLQAGIMFAAGLVILWLGRRWYWPLPGTPLPYYRAHLTSERQPPEV